MKTFFIADTHFGHFNVINHDGRPFRSIEEHDETLISNWNSVVGENDIVYHLGDFFWTKFQLNYLNRLNAKEIRLVEGNHDKNWKVKTFIHPKLVKLGHMHELNWNDRKIILCHYPLLSWHKKERGAIHLYGHVHTDYHDTDNRYSVSCNILRMNYFPKQLHEIIPQLQVVKITLGTKNT